MELVLRVNGKKRKVDVPPMKRLLDTLREELGLTGTKEGCGEGECGACTVLVDGEAVNACLVPTVQAEGHEVTTIEAEGKGYGRLAKLQSAFLECGGAQCGICTPGMIMAACALPPSPSREEIREGLAGNLCRCTGYMKIYDSVEQALGSDGKRTRKAAPASGAHAASDRKGAAKASRPGERKAAPAPAGTPRPSGERKAAR